MGTIANLAYASANDVSAPCEDYNAHQEELALVKALHGGTKAMRAAGVTFLPQEDGETPTAYLARVKRSALTNYYKRTLEKLTGQAFQEDITPSEDLPQEIEDLLSDIDLEGSNVSLFMQRALYKAIHKGVAHIMVEYPTVNGKTVADHKKAGARPYWVLIDPDNVIGWRHKYKNGVKKLTQLRVKETIVVDDGEYGTKNEERIRVYEPGWWKIMVGGENGWEVGLDPETGLPMEGATSLDYIPLVAYMIGEKTSEMTATPCLADLAELNCIHWQSSSDQRNILHYARLITYFGKLLDVDEGGKVIFGANKLVHSNSPEADLKIVEHSGAGIEAGRNDLKDLELAMAIFGLTMMLPKVSGVTATETSVEKGESDSALTTWVKAMASCLETLLAYTCNWISVKPAGALTPFTDFSTGMSTTDATTLIEGFKAGLLPKELVIEELKERGIISQDVDMVEIMRQFEEDARQSTLMNPALNMNGQTAPGQQPGTPKEEGPGKPAQK